MPGNVWQGGSPESANGVQWPLQGVRDGWDSWREPLGSLQLRRLSRVSPRRDCGACSQPGCGGRASQAFWVRDVDMELDHLLFPARLCSFFTSVISLLLALYSGVDHFTLCLLNCCILGVCYIYIHTYMYIHIHI